MEVRIGILNAPREVGFESSQSPAAIEQTVADAIAGSAGYVAFADDKGRRFLVPTAAIGYVEIGAEESRRVGFIA